MGLTSNEEKTLHCGMTNEKMTYVAIGMVGRGSVTEDAAGVDGARWMDALSWEAVLWSGL